MIWGKCVDILNLFAQADFFERIAHHLILVDGDDKTGAALGATVFPLREEEKERSDN